MFTSYLKYGSLIPARRAVAFRDPNSVAAADMDGAGASCFRLLCSQTVHGNFGGEEQGCQNDGDTSSRSYTFQEPPRPSARIATSPSTARRLLRQSVATSGPLLMHGRYGTLNAQSKRRSRGPIVLTVGARAFLTADWT